MAKAEAADMSSRLKGRVALLVVSLLLIYLLITRSQSFEDSWGVLSGADPWRVLIASVFVAVTYILSGAVYTLLGLRRLRFGRTILVQAASAFANRLLPAGLGGLTINVQYLRKSKHTTAQALAVAGTNNLLGFAGHLLLLFAVIVASKGALFSKLHAPHASLPLILGIIAAVIIIANVIVFSRLKHYLYALTADVVHNLLLYRKKPGKLSAALFCSVLLTSCYVGVLYLCCQAVGADLSLWNAFAVFTVGIAAATVTPTPGGLGGAEAGLVAALVAYGFDASTALAATLLYRLLTYWLPLLPGFAFFVSIRKRLV